MRALYHPKGPAGEYGKLAVNLYTGGCPHKCRYCYVPGVLHKTREQWEAEPCQPKPEIFLEQLVRGLRRYASCVHALDERPLPQVFMCFTCDPFPEGINTDITCWAIKACHEHGFGVRLLTKNGEGSMRVLPLLNEQDSFGVTAISTDSERRAYWEPQAPSPILRLNALKNAKLAGISTWISMEPVVGLQDSINILSDWGRWADEIKIGRLNYCQEAGLFDWKNVAQVLAKVSHDLDLPVTFKTSMAELLVGS
jgi:DNA repair photolyase